MWLYICLMLFEQAAGCILSIMLIVHVWNFMHAIKGVWILFIDISEQPEFMKSIVLVIRFAIVARIYMYGTVGIILCGIVTGRLEEYKVPAADTSRLNAFTRLVSANDVVVAGNCSICMEDFDPNN